MTDEVENHTIRLLQEMRAEMRAQGERLDRLTADMSSRFDDVTNRIDGNTILLNMVAGLPSNHEDRITKLERERV